MKVSASGPSDRGRDAVIPHPSGASGTTTRTRVAIGIAAAYAVAHLPSLARSLEDIDSINFALGLHDFDPSRHQPHPPGYPVYIALGRAVLLLVQSAAPGLEPARADAVALALLSLAGAIVAIVAAFVLFAEFAALFHRDATSSATSAAADPAIWATLLLAVAPLFWVSGLRPMSDMPGLAAALVTQALTLRAVRTRDGRALVIASFVAGLALGIRVQTLWLTAPLLAWALIRRREAGVVWLVSRPVAAAAIGAVLWAVPLIALSGGVDGYLRALGSQAGEDFAWVNMLWGDPTPRHLAFALLQTFVLPWSSSAIAGVIVAAAMAGALILLVRDRVALAILLVAFAPYLVFHLLLQETVTVRYALPAMPLVALLAARGMLAVPRAGAIAAAVVVAGAAVTSVPGGVAYGREAHPAFRAIADMNRAARTGKPAAVFSHYALRRPLQSAAAAALPVVEPRRSYEWLGPVEYWQSGGRDPIWFLADPRRTDLASIDPRSRGDVTHYAWSVAGRPEFGGTRPLDVDWYRLDPPGWYLTEGWSLTAETGGIARASGRGVDRQPITAFVRRRSGAANLIVGGRHLGAADGPPTTYTIAIDDRPLETWRHDPAAEGLNFLRILSLPDGLLSGPEGYARLTITARGDGASVPAVAIRQFDLQPTTGLAVAFGDGWHEDEYDNATGAHWRWTSERSVLRIVPPQAVTLLIRGESPIRYFGAAPTVRVTTGARVVAELHPGADFEWRVTVPADAVSGSNGAVAIETDRVYRPGEVEGTADRRHLGLRLYDLRVDPVLH